MWEKEVAAGETVVVEGAGGETDVLPGHPVQFADWVCDYP